MPSSKEKAKNRFLQTIFNTSVSWMKIYGTKMDNFKDLNSKQYFIRAGVIGTNCVFKNFRSRKKTAEKRCTIPTLSSVFLLIRFSGKQRMLHFLLFLRPMEEEEYTQYKKKESDVQILRLQQSFSCFVP